MKSTVETLSPTRVRLDVEVPFDELKPSIDKAYKNIARQISVPGFRKGKIPPRLVDQRVGRAAVLEEGINDAIPTYLSKAFEEHTLRVLGRPDVSLNELEDGDRVSFSADVEVRPELNLPDFSTIEITVDDIEISDTDIDAEIDKLRDRFATLKKVDRPAADGDYIGIDLRAVIDGEEIPGGSASNVSYHVGSGDLLDGLDDAVRGKATGEEVAFASKLAGGEHAGAEAEVTATLRSVKEKDLPELDSDFAQANSEFDSIEELREGLRKQLAESGKRDQAVEARDQALKDLVTATEVPLPERVVDSEIESRKEQLTGYLQQFGSTLQSYLESQKKSEEEFDAELRTDAEDAVRSQLVLDTIADAEELGVTDTELTQEVVRRSQAAQMEPQAYADHLVRTRQLALVAADLRRGKALSIVLERVQVVDSAGAKIDADEIRSRITAGSAE